MKEGFPYNLIIALAGPYGAGCSSLAKELKDAVVNWPACHGEVIHVADLIQNSYEALTSELLDIPNIPSKKREILQSAGTNLRIKDPSLVGNLIATEIYKRGLSIEETKNVSDIGTLVFIVDSLKNLNDLKVLKRIYSNEFYLIFVHANKETRWGRITNYKSWNINNKSEFDRLDDIDSDEKLLKDVKDAGQQVRKLAAEADYYIVNNIDRNSLRKEGNRFLELFFESESNQPTLHERSMHVAYSASNGSYCLSRQVGAAIIDEEGNILSVGHNDVPKECGGLYSLENPDDKRCYNVGDRRCINDLNKEERFDKLTADISKEIGEIISIELIDNAIKHSEFKDLIEYCRAVHAEMDALLNLCRVPRCSTVGKTMYVTTQPCHNCTKHILCAGLDKVIYIEPYPKSLAGELHSDSIILDPIDGTCDNKLKFIPYPGVAPHRYHDFFVAREERKDNKGFKITRTKQDSAFKPRFADELWRRSRKDENHLDPITMKEMKALEDFAKLIKGNDIEVGGEVSNNGGEDSD